MSVLDEVLKDLAEIGAVGAGPLMESKRMEAAAPEQQSPIPRVNLSRVIERINMLRERLDDAEMVVREVKMTLFEVENELDTYGEGHGKLSKKS